MPIPDFQTLMLPMLKSTADGKEHGHPELLNSLAVTFNLGDEEVNELLPSGRQTRLDNRSRWAKIYLLRSGLLEYSRRGFVKITERGKAVLAQNPAKIDLTFLKQFPEYVEFKQKGKAGINAIPQEDSFAEREITPEEIIEKGYFEIRKALASDLLEQVLAISPTRFERLVIDLLVKMGYGGGFKDAGTHSGKSGDEGIDGTIKEDKLGLDIIYIQAKKWKPGNVVGRPEIQKFVGALAGQGAKKGIFITTSSFTKEARDYTPRNETKIVLIDGDELAQLMIDHNLGVSIISTYEVKRVDSDYFGEE
jgi:restriction system protein